MARGLPPRPPAGMGPGMTRGGKHMGMSRRRDYTPVSWDKYFETTDQTIVTSLVNCRTLAVDLRGHGDSQAKEEDDLSADQLAEDVGNLVSALYGDEPPPIILVGHSMGGAIAIHAAVQEKVQSLVGMVVIDVVEGTALDALHSMQSFLRGRPKSFPTLEAAIEWCVRSGQVRNLESAKVSMVGQVKKTDTQETGTSLLEREIANEPNVGVNLSSDAIVEEEEPTSPSQDMPPPASPPPSMTEAPPGSYTWRIDLSSTEKYWKGWFAGMSQLFLSCNVPKMLLLAGVDRLDRDLTIGQMQGKFQMQVLPQCGHAVHEDAPDKVAEALATFMVRHRFAEATADFKR
ncbi:PPME1 [Branchiostoma lanceolatum]|uniref:Protein phosphatase methylesterase 1 n=1 Tax=Branchiostoma lanceolatum TaxID=7740 RepID=A0A8K0A785_BRALA|nr:PPME1 [Branchiostoma lanceolatum]